ncbi:MAG TPA: metalloregulator ArsR/SmtB family transcription factor [Hyphomicrobiaceae bacterium]|nr:metalloregulator ArsR/SmtB family transcription factor [Hyphomicrobiaceae bacterium]
MTPVLELDPLLSALKAVAEPTRLRLLALLADGELNVKDLTRILGQSQPRISRHLKLLTEAGVVERVREGSWAYFRLSDATSVAGFARDLVGAIDQSDALIQRDRARAEALRRERAEAAQAFFREYAAEWDQIRSLYLAEGEVEAAMRTALGPGPFDLLLDLGTGTGRMLELFADCYRRAIGIDASHSMLAVARAKLDRARLRRAQVRHGDIYHLGLDDGVADAVVMHQVLHYLSDPDQALREAARVLSPGGRLIVVDFAPHELEFLRQSHAHVHLGFSPGQVEQWLSGAGLKTLMTKELRPPPKARSEKLTVLLWLAGRAPVANAEAGKRALESLA